MMSDFNWDAFFESWEMEHEISVFAKDGIVCPEEYENILFVLKDVNNAKPGDEIDLRVSLQTRIDEGHTWFDLACWAATLLDGKITETMTHTLQHQYMRRVAVMNIKKEAGGPKVSDSTIRKYGSLHSAKLLDEIKACHPKLIVACSSIVFKSLDEFVFGRDRKDEHQQIELNAKMSMYGHYFDISSYLNSETPVYVVEYRHPNQCGKQGTRKEHGENMLKIRQFVFGD